MYMINERTPGSYDLSPAAISYTPGRTPRRQSSAVIQRTLVTLLGSTSGPYRFSSILSRASKSFFIDPHLLSQHSDQWVPWVCQESVSVPKRFLEHPLLWLVSAGRTLQFQTSAGDLRSFGPSPDLLARSAGLTLPLRSL